MSIPCNAIGSLSPSNLASCLSRKRNAMPLRISTSSPPPPRPTHSLHTTPPRVPFHFLPLLPRRPAASPPHRPAVRPLSHINMEPPRLLLDNVFPTRAKTTPNAPPLANMLLKAAHLPTNAEASALTSLVATSVHCPPSIPDAIADVFSFSRHHWIVDFLFNADLTSISALTAPVNLSNAVTCAVSMTSVEPSSTASTNPTATCGAAHMFDIHLNSNYVFVPAFSVGPSSVGFGVQSCDLHCHANWQDDICHQQGAAMTHFRYLRDDERGTLTVVHDIPEDDTIKVHHMLHKTATVRDRTFILMRRSALMSALEQNFLPLRPEIFIAPTLILQTCTEYRDCPFCGASRTARCRCKLQLVVPKHPLDFSSLSHNMDAFLGAFEGTTKARFCPNGTELLSARLGTRINIIGGCDEALITQFSKWAISDQLEKTKLNPVKALMPGTLRREEEAEHGLIPPQKRARTNPFLSDDGLLVSDSLSETPVTETPVTETFDSMNVGMPIVKDIDDMDDFGAFLTDPLAAPIVKEVASGMDVMGGSEALGTAANPVALTEQASCASTKGDMTEEKSVSVDEDDGLELVQRIAEEAHHQFQMENGLNARSMPSASSRSQKTMIEKMALHGYGSMLTQAGSGQSGLRNGATVIAPASTRIAPATHVESEEGHEVLECERDRKAELRKQRNREAAQRSNAKRKLKNDTLKSELQACHTKAAELRAKELSLREENIKLRKLLSS